MNAADPITATANTVRPGRSDVLRKPSRVTDRGVEATLRRRREASNARHAIRIDAPAPKNAPAGSTLPSAAPAIRDTPIAAKTIAAPRARAFAAPPRREARIDVPSAMLPASRFRSDTRPSPWSVHQTQTRAAITAPAAPPRSDTADT